MSMAGSAFEILVDNRQKRVRLSPLKIAGWAKKILKVLGWKRAGLSFVFVNDSEIRRYHRQYLGEDRPTDVLAFGQIERVFSPSKTPFLGDIVISVETARREAPRYGHRWDEELLLYICHGVLHLKGYRDGTPRQKAAMERKQKEILKKVRGKNLWPSKKPKRLF